jgi:membrane protein YqaA with SNARE-associated domain
MHLPRPRLLRRLWAWVLHWADTPWGTPALAAVSFAESSVFPVPPDVLQIALSASRPERAFFYATVSTLASVLGGVGGWLLGVLAWNALSGSLLASLPGLGAESFEQVRSLYLDNAFLAILGAAFTPIPYKVFTIASGSFGVPLPTLVIASLIGRGARFFAVAACLRVLGAPAVAILDRHLELATLLLGAAALVVVVAVAGLG